MKICTGKNIGNVAQTDIHCCLLNVYRDKKMDVVTVRKWTTHFNRGIQLDVWKWITFSWVNFYECCRKTCLRVSNRLVVVTIWKIKFSKLKTHSIQWCYCTSSTVPIKNKQILFLEHPLYAKFWEWSILVLLNRYAGLTNAPQKVSRLTPS